MTYLSLTNSWGTKTPWRRDRLPTPVFSGFPGDSDGKESACNAEDLSSILALGRSPEGGHGNPLQYFCPGNPLKQRSLVGYSPRAHKELDTTEQLSANTHTHTHKYISLKFSFTRQGTHLSLMDQFNFLKSYAFY